MEIKEKILNLLHKFFLLHNEDSELKDVRSLNVTPVSHFVKAEPLDNFFFSIKVSAYLNVFRRKKIGLTLIEINVLCEVPFYFMCICRKFKIICV